MIGASIKLVKNNIHLIEEERKRGVKSFETASKVEGFRLMKLLKQDLKEGKAGPVRFDPLTEIAKAMGKPKDRTPYQKFARLIGYQSQRQGERFFVWVGWLGLRRKGRFGLSASYERILTEMQTGKQFPVTEELRKRIGEWGYARRRRKAAEARYFFIRRSTTRFMLRARNAIQPFWDAHKAEARTNVARNFERKMRGERI